MRGGMQQRTMLLGGLAVTLFVVSTEERVWVLWLVGFDGGRAGMRAFSKKPGMLEQLAATCCILHFAVQRTNYSQAAYLHS